MVTCTHVHMHIALKVTYPFIQITCKAFAQSSNMPCTFIYLSYLYVDNKTGMTKKKLHHLEGL